MNMESLDILAAWAGVHPLFIALAIAWTLAWKGVALWRAAGLRQKYWFIVLLLINTLGLLEIIYLLFIARNYRVEVVEER